MNKNLLKVQKVSHSNSLIININAFNSITDQPKFIKITKNPENSSKFDEIIKLKHINDSLRSENEKMLKTITNNDKSFQKTIKDFHIEEKVYQIQIKFYHDQWSDCRERYDEMKRIVDNFRNSIREREMNGSLEEVEEVLSSKSDEREE